MKALPWAALLQAAVIVGSRWEALSEKERARITALVRETAARPGKLGARERKELRRLAGKLDLAGMSRELLALVRAQLARRKPRR